MSRSSTQQDRTTVVPDTRTGTEYVIHVARETDSIVPWIRWTGQVSSGRVIVAAFWAPTRRGAIRRAERHVDAALRKNGVLCDGGFMYDYPGDLARR